MISISVETNTSRHIEAVISDGIPVVQFDRVRSDIKTSKIINDNFQTAFNATEHLIQLGRRNIAFFAGQLYINIYKERYEGYCAALKKHNIELNKALVSEGVITKEKGRDVFAGLLKKKLRPDAILATSDYSALGALLVAREKNISIPDELAIVGFANEPFTEFLSPSLSTIDQSAQEMGYEAAKILIDEIENRNKQIVEKIISSKLIIRQSSDAKL